MPRAVSQRQKSVEEKIKLHVFGINIDPHAKERQVFDSKMIRFSSWPSFGKYR